MPPPARHIGVMGCPGGHPTGWIPEHAQAPGWAGGTGACRNGAGHQKGATGLSWCPAATGAPCSASASRRRWGRPRGTPGRWARGLAVAAGGFPRFVAQQGKIWQGLPRPVPWQAAAPGAAGEGRTGAWGPRPCPLSQCKPHFF